MKLIEMLEKRNEALKVSEVARILGVTPQHIYKMASAGLIPCFHVKGAIRFWPSELAEWIRKELERAEKKRNAHGKENTQKHPDVRVIADSSEFLCVKTHVSRSRLRSATSLVRLRLSTQSPAHGFPLRHCRIHTSSR